MGATRPLAASRHPPRYSIASARGQFCAPLAPLGVGARRRLGWPLAPWFQGGPLSLTGQRAASAVRNRNAGRSLQQAPFTGRYWAEGFARRLGTCNVRLGPLPHSRKRSGGTPSRLGRRKRRPRPSAVPPPASAACFPVSVGRWSPSVSGARLPLPRPSVGSAFFLARSRGALVAPRGLPRGRLRRGAPGRPRPRSRGRSPLGCGLPPLRSGRPCSLRPPAVPVPRAGGPCAPSCGFAPPPSLRPSPRSGGARWAASPPLFPRAPPLRFFGDCGPAGPLLHHSPPSGARPSPAPRWAAFSFVRRSPLRPPPPRRPRWGLRGARGWKGLDQSPSPSSWDVHRPLSFLSPHYTRHSNLSRASKWPRWGHP